MRILTWVICPFILLLRFSIPAKEKNHVFSKKDEPSWMDTTSEKGRKVFNASCLSCHKDSGLSAGPAKTILGAMTPRAVYAALMNGKMKIQAASLTESEKKAVAQWVTGGKLVETRLPDQAFMNFSLPASSTSIPVISGWGGDLKGSGFRNVQQAGISITNLSTLTLKWAFAFPDATVMRAKPAVVGDWIIVGGQYGELFAINKRTGKIGWQFSASSAIRGAVFISKELNNLIAYFSDFSTTVYAVDVRTGKLIWSARSGFDPLSANTGSVVVYNGIVYVPISSLEVALAANGNYPCCSSSGGVVALDAKTGKQIWKYRVVGEPAREVGKKNNGKPYFGPAGGPVWCSPTVDAKRGLLFIGTGENYSKPTTNSSDAIQALDLKTGKLVWNFQATEEDYYNLACPFLVNCPGKGGPDLDFGMAPILVKTKNGNEILVAGQKAGVVFALTPDRGRLIWKQRIGKGGALGGIHWGMATDGNYVYASNADNIIAIDKRDSAVQASPGLYALDLISGKIAWKIPSANCQGKTGCLSANSAAPVVIPGIVFAGELDGHIRAHATSDGKILWDFDTAKEFETINGIKGKGGAIDGPPPVVSDGMLFVNSGYGMFGEMSGNLLLAFEVTKKIR
ncbi:MAG: PQQ-binding-like beta-propeller repeat protein [Chitinophagales bacterium]